MLNETELAFYSTSATDAASAARKLIRRAEQVVVVTLGADGAMAVFGEKVLRIEGRKVKAIDTTGAGDCFVGCLAARLSTGDDLESALRYSNGAASICVMRKGAASSMPSRIEVEALVTA